MDEEKKSEILEKKFVWRIPDCCKDVMDGKREYCPHSSQPEERKKKNVAL